MKFTEKTIQEAFDRSKKLADKVGDLLEGHDIMTVEMTLAMLLVGVFEQLNLTEAEINERITSLASSVSFREEAVH